MSPPFARTTTFSVSLIKFDPAVTTTAARCTIKKSILKSEATSSPA
jgi:hypothetical protein